MFRTTDYLIGVAQAPVRDVTSSEIRDEVQTELNGMMQDIATQVAEKAQVSLSQTYLPRTDIIRGSNVYVGRRAAPAPSAAVSGHQHVSFWPCCPQYAAR